MRKNLFDLIQEIINDRQDEIIDHVSKDILMDVINFVLFQIKVENQSDAEKIFDAISHHTEIQRKIKKNV